jgi:hypothetical protein
MRLSALCLFGALVGGSAFAADEYLFDTLKKPAYRKVWNAMLAKEKNIPHWLTVFSRNYDAPATPVETVTVDGKTYLSGYVCMPHNCPDNALAVMFGEKGSSIVGVLIDNREVRYFGAPDAAMKAALDKAVGR